LVAVKLQAMTWEVNWRDRSENI